MTTTTFAQKPPAAAAGMNTFERYLTVWVFLCIVAGIALVFSICLIACLLPFHRLRGIDPAVVLQG